MKILSVFGLYTMSEVNIMIDEFKKERLPRNISGAYIYFPNPVFIRKIGTYQTIAVQGDREALRMIETGKYTGSFDRLPFEHIDHNIII